MIRYAWDNPQLMSSTHLMPVFALGAESTWDDLENGMAASAEYQSATYGRIIPLMCFAPTMEPVNADRWEPLQGLPRDLLIVSIERSTDKMLLKTCERAKPALGELRLGRSFPAVKVEDAQPLADVYRQMSEQGVFAFALSFQGKDAPSFFFVRGEPAVLAFHQALLAVTRKLQR